MKNLIRTMSELMYFSLNNHKYKKYEKARKTLELFKI